MKQTAHEWRNATRYREKEEEDDFIRCGGNKTVYSAFLCREGAEAYRREEFSKAFELYRQSAELGNVIAQSNLGYCYYYGRGVAIDKEKARNCWETAAVLGGDVAGIYKLGDMHRNGDIECNPEIAWLYYERAYRIAKWTKDIETYPDVCLRLLRFGKGKLSRKEMACLAGEAVQCLEERMERGDCFSGDLLEEARKFYRENREG